MIKIYKETGAPKTDYALRLFEGEDRVYLRIVNNAKGTPVRASFVFTITANGIYLEPDVNREAMRALGIKTDHGKIAIADSPFTDDTDVDDDDEEEDW